MENEEKYMQEALKEAKKAYKKLEVPVGAIIVKNGEIIEQGEHNALLRQNGFYKKLLN